MYSRIRIPSLGLELALLLGSLIGCGGGTTPVQQFSMSISPSPVNVAAEATEQFSVTVTGASSTTVTWQVNGLAGGNATAGTITDAGLYTAPAAATTATVAAVLKADSSKSASARVSVLAPHRIGIRPTASIAEFYDRSTGNSFVPRGANYVRLGAQNCPNAPPADHTVFNVGLYDGTTVDAALALMQASGYTMVRVFLNGWCPQNTLGNPAGGLSSAYLANVVDFLGRSKNHGMFVIIDIDWLPLYGGYSEQYATCTNFVDFNTLNLCPNGVQASTSFFHDLVLLCYKKD